jgi:hypothetical protein
MARRTVAGLTLTLLLAIPSAGCGSASQSKSSSASPTPTSASGSTVSPAAQAVPPGFARYQANGFSFVAPSGFKVAPNGGVGGLPRGVSVQFLTPGGKRLENTSTQIIVGVNPHLRAGLDAVATSLEAADANSPSLTHVHTNVSTMTLPGAADVRIVTESYVGPGGGRTRTHFRRTWLMVSPRRGTLLDLVVVDEPQRGGNLDAATVLDSFRLDHST